MAISLALALAVLSVTGCGDDSVAEGATVRVYLSADLCAEAKRELAETGGEAGDVEVESVCLAPTERVQADAGGSRLDLAAIGANARRATQDSSTIAYVESKGPANRFAQPIVEEAGIAYVNASSGEDAVRRVLQAVESAGSSSLRDEVRGSLEAE